MFDLPRWLGTLQRVEHELLLFASFWFIVAAVDELTIDLSWLWLRVTGQAGDRRLPKGFDTARSTGKMAVFVPAWQEAAVIGTMIAHTLKAWPQPDMVLFVGCYANDPATLAAATAGTGGDGRVRLVVNDRAGPTTKADCLNRLYAALYEEEALGEFSFAGVVLHDAEDMVHPAALAVIEQAIAQVSFVQLPVRPEPQPGSPWVAGHYTDEFTEAHAKLMVVRDRLGAAIPAAGVGCGFARQALAMLAENRSAQGEDGPFSSECLTEDYELGLLLSSGGRKGRFLRLRDAADELVATRAFFPAKFPAAIRQKARWMHGIAFQGWDRLGWEGRPIDIWMALRDRRGPLTAIVLTVAYVLLFIEALLGLARLAGWQSDIGLSPLLGTMISISFASLVWRLVWRFGFTAGEYGLVEGLRAVPRAMIANFITIFAGARALMAYLRTLRGAAPTWDKTSHTDHPAALIAADAVSR